MHLGPIYPPSYNGTNNEEGAENLPSYLKRIDGKIVTLDQCSFISLAYTKNATGTVTVTNVETQQQTIYKAEDGVLPVIDKRKHQGLIQHYKVDATNATGVQVNTLGCEIVEDNNNTN